MPFHSVKFGSKTILFKLQFSNRKTLGISVLPDLSVVVTAPENTINLFKIKETIHKRAAWIVKQQAKFEEYLPKQPPRRYVSGETHLYLGRQYRIKLIKKDEEKIKIKAGYILVELDNPENPKRVERLINEWYLKRAKEIFERKVAGCLEGLKRYKLSLPILRLRSMVKRWGSCSPSGIITLNPELVKKPSSCIEYVITHELCHLVHPHHDRKFYLLLQKTMPDWRARKNRLEKVS